MRLLIFAYQVVTNSAGVYMQVGGIKMMRIAKLFMNRRKISVLIINKSNYMIQPCHSFRIPFIIINKSNYMLYIVTVSMKQ